MVTHSNARGERLMGDGDDGLMDRVFSTTTTTTTLADPVPRQHRAGGSTQSLRE
jgi:hypothetical protein